MIIMRPSKVGIRSTVPRSATISANVSSFFLPNSGCVTSRALNMHVTLTLLPSLRNLMALPTLVCRSCSAMRGLIFIPLTSCCLLFLSLPCFPSRYLCLP